MLLSLPNTALSAAVVADATTQADAAIQSGQWQQAITLSKALVEQAPSAENWRKLGRAYIGAGDFQQAELALQKSLALDPQLQSAQFSMAVVQDHLGHADQAFKYLDEAVAQGITPQQLRTHPALAHLRQDKRFQTVLDEADRISFPCLHEPRYLAFDFWVGEWDVYSGGVKSAHNSITRDVAGCMIHEHWTDAGGLTESINYYDPETGKWHENLVDYSGRIARYSGGPIAGGAMQMLGASTTNDGHTVLARATWTPLAGGGLRHLVEHSDDGGKTWTVAYDGTYSKAAPADAASAKP